jgi:hypothetical protein
MGASCQIKISMTLINILEFRQAIEDQAEAVELR